jgi:Family of unknown function (DUF6152)
MRKALTLVCSVIVMSLISAGIALAHHGRAGYDTAENGKVVKGVVTEYRWLNPHVFILWNAKDDKGNTVTWTGEFSSPSSMLSEGMSKSSFKPGDEIAVTVIPAKGGTPYGLVLKIVRPDGKVVVDLSERRGVLLQ